MKEEGGGECKTHPINCQAALDLQQELLCMGSREVEQNQESSENTYKILSASLRKTIDPLICGH